MKSKFAERENVSLLKLEQKSNKKALRSISTYKWQIPCSMLDATRLSLNPFAFRGHKQSFAGFELRSKCKTTGTLYCYFILLIILADCRVTRRLIFFDATFGQQQNLRPPIFDMWRRCFQLEESISSCTHRQTLNSITPLFFGP
ncbi:hypothetical protein BpHYR1_008670 [Brachionus plicatilis]|uniref:Uncharacterized protein n=1 Tax=Brachionus plicatilis TaxID=10195 RepID=A0A3M7QGD9_BRAPC|nr:hypothetical protein BpHYR1_008670 [Brachionus plicatilis]